MTNHLPRLPFSALFPGAGPTPGEARLLNRQLCFDGLKKREHLDFVSLAEKDQIFFRILRDEDFDAVEWTLSKSHQ